MKKFLVASLLAMGVALPATAHFQLVYNPEANPDAPGDMPFKLIFWHPFENGHAMDMGTPEEFFVIFKGEKTDLSDRVTPLTFHGAHNNATAFEGVVPIKRNGDYIVGLVPAPYYEESEDIYIQQLTKTYVNKGGIPSGWDAPAGMKTEFLPLNKPYGAVVGSTFSAQLISDGKPVPGAEIEIEYLAAEPNMETNAPGETTAEPIPGGALVALTDDNGVFTFGVPKSGWWGFAALGSGPDTEFDGKELSQDAVIWIRAYDLK